MSLENSIKLNEIYNIDCLIGMQRIQDKSIDMILCDLPYGITKSSWDIPLPFDKLWNQYIRIIKDKGAIVLFSNGLFTSIDRINFHTTQLQFLGGEAPVIAK